MYVIFTNNNEKRNKEIHNFLSFISLSRASVVFADKMLTSEIFNSLVISK